MSSIIQNKSVQFMVAGVSLLIVDHLLYKYFGISFINQINKFQDKPINNKRESQFEGDVRQILTDMTGKQWISTRPNWLKNPTTKRNLELDCYNQQLKTAIEVQGIQHYQYCPAFHRSFQDFKDQQERDKLKAELCRRHGVKLIYVPCNISKNKIKIKELLKKELNI